MLECLRANANIQTERRLLVLLTFYGIVITLLHIGEPSCGVEDISRVFLLRQIIMNHQLLHQKFVSIENIKTGVSREMIFRKWFVLAF